MSFQEGQVREWRTVAGGSRLVELRQCVRTILTDDGNYPGVDTEVPLWDCRDILSGDHVLCGGNRLGEPLTEMEVIAWSAK